MNHSRITLAITAIVAAASVATIVFTVPQQVMAGGYHHHYHHHNNNHKNGIMVDQQINQENNCTNQTLCANTGNNQANIHR
jgi:hypothetical protein